MRLHLYQSAPSSARCAPVHPAGKWQIFTQLFTDPLMNRVGAITSTNASSSKPTGLCSLGVGTDRDQYVNGWHSALVKSSHLMIQLVRRCQIMTSGREDHTFSSPATTRFGKFCSKSSIAVLPDTAHPVRPSAPAAGRLLTAFVVITLQNGRGEVKLA